MTTSFEESYQNYTNQLQEYRGKVNSLKDAAQSGDWKSLLQEGGELVGTPLSTELLRHGLKKMGTKNSGKAPKVKSEQKKGDQPADDADEADAEDFPSVLGRLNAAREDPFPEVSGEPDFQALLGKGPSFAKKPLGDTLQETELSDIKPGMPQDAPEAEAEGPDIPGRAPDALEDLEPKSELPGQIQRTTTLQSGEQTSTDDFGLRARLGKDLDPEFGEEDTQPGMIARLFGARSGPATQVTSDDTAEAANALARNATSSLRNVLSRPAVDTGGPMGDSTLARSLGMQAKAGAQTAGDTDANAADALAKTVSSNLRQVEQVTGASEETAERAIQSGANAIQDGTKLIGGVSDAVDSATTAAAGGVDSALSSASEAAAAAGGETEGLGFVAAGLIGLGGVLYDVFSGHKNSSPSIPLPKLSIPTFSPGLATSE